MISLLIILVFICFYGIKFNKNGIYHDYLSKTQTTAIRGIFACIIFASHLRGYITLNGAMDQVYNTILSLIGQCMVSVFFFYSGYGIMSGYKRKKRYEESFLEKRLFFTWFHFVIAVVFYNLINLLLNIRYPIQTVILSFTGWETVGNSNWFMFDTFLLYILVWITFKIINIVLKNGADKQKYFPIIIMIFTGIMIVMLHFTKQSWWYDTLLCFPLGVFYSNYQEKIDIYMRSYRTYLLVGFGSIFFYYITYKMGNFVSYNVCACFFVLIITWFTMKIKVDNKILNWLGLHSFYIYIYMRIPMIILSKIEGFSEHRYVFAVLSLLFTLLLSWIMAKIQTKLDTGMQRIINQERK